MTTSIWNWLWTQKPIVSQAETKIYWCSILSEEYQSYQFELLVSQYSKTTLRALMLVEER